MLAITGHRYCNNIFARDSVILYSVFFGQISFGQIWDTNTCENKKIPSTLQSVQSQVFLTSTTMISLPTTQTAIVATTDDSLAVSVDVSVPTLHPDMIIVKNAAISINPVDIKLDGPYSTPGAIAGCDFAGTIVALGSAVTHDVRVGDRVCGAVMGMNPLEPSVGAFATYVGAQGDLVLTIPRGMSFATAAALPTVFATAGLALFRSLGLEATPSKPAEKPFPVLVYGGSTATGTTAIQLLKLSGLIPVVTCSPRNFELARSYGAVAAFDYRSPTCAADIRAFTKNSLRYALDCITGQESIRLCYAAIGRAGGKYTALDPYPEAVAKTRQVVVADWVLGPTMLGKDIAWPPPHEIKGSKELRDFGESWLAVVQRLLDEGKIRVHPLKIMEGDFQDVLQGIETVRTGKMSGQKLVYSLV